MSIVPSRIRFDRMVRIPNTAWSYIQHSPTLQLWFHQDWPMRGEASYHVSVFYRTNGIDIHSTFFYFNRRQQKYEKRHHGLCYHNGRQIRRIRRRPSRLPELFERFQNDIHLLLEVPILEHIPETFFARF